MAKAKTIRVLFLDADSGAPLGQSEVPAAQIPDSFEARTTLNLGGQDWEVTAAEPMTRAEYERAGALRLALRKITISPVPFSDLLYSLPTICDEAPGVAPGTSKLGKKVLELHEDDWRQIELVSLSQQGLIDAGLAAVRRVYAEQRTPQGFFKDLHVRKEVARPLEGCRLSLPEVYGYFPAFTPLDGLAYRDVAGLIEGGFASAAPSGLRLYGVVRDGAVAALGLWPNAAAAGVEGEAPALAALMGEHELCLVDWCRAQQVPADEGAVTEYLKSWPTR